MFSKNRLTNSVFSSFVILALMLAFFTPASVVLAQDQNPPTDISDVNTAPLTQVVIPKGATIIPDHYIVVFKSDFVAANAAKSIKASVAANGGEVKNVYAAALNGYSAYLPAKALTAVLADPNVDYVEADAVVSLEQDISTETVQTGATWGLDRIDQRILPLTTTYSYTGTGAGVNVYILDTGINSTHTQFGGRATKDYDAVGDGQNGNDCHGHGTHVAGTIGGSTYGVAKGVKLHAVRVLNCSGTGSYSWVIAGVDWVTTHHVHPAVANMSLGGGGYAPLDTALNTMIAHGVVLVVAAGNSNDDACLYSPARVPNAITVGATTNTDARASYSNYGTCLDIFAPGSDITSAWIGSNTATNTISGTSMASPHVAGVVALYLQTHTTASAAAVTTAIKNFATIGLVTNPGTGSVNKLLFSMVNSVLTRVPILVSPSGATTDTTPTFKWEKVYSATRYRLLAYRGSTLVVNQSMTTTACSGYYCTYTQPTALPVAAYTWRVSAYVGTTWTAYSANNSFTILAPAAGFTSYFTTDAAGWTPVKGAWSVVPGTYRSPGIFGYVSSTAHSGIYTNFDYTVVMERSTDASGANGIYFRGVPAPLDSKYNWKNSYSFQYSNNGYYSIFSVVNGSFTAIVPWTLTANILPYGWNTLRVTANGSTLYFYINGHLLASGTDTKLSNGQVGIEFYNNVVSGGMFYVDTAKLTTLSSSSIPTAADLVGAATFNPRRATEADANMAPAR